MEEIWRNAVIDLLREFYVQISPGTVTYSMKNSGSGTGKVHFMKKMHGAWRSVKYLGRYLNWPQSSVTTAATMTQEEMIERYISHIPAKHFKMMRYYGFLSRRKRGTLLPKIYDVLEMETRKKPEQSGFTALMKGFLRMDTYKCILCGNRLRFTRPQAGRHATDLMVKRLRSIDQKQWFLAQAAG